MQNQIKQCSSIERNEKQIGARLGGNYVNAVPRFTEQEAADLKEKLINNETYKEAMQILIAWLDNGECNEENSSCFFLLIELCSNHVNKLRIEHDEYVKESERTEKNVLKESFFQLQLEEFVDVFEAANRKDLWSYFSSNQSVKIFEILINLQNLQHNIFNDCVGDVSQVDVSCELTVEVLPLDCHIYEIEAKLPGFTNEVNTIYQLSKEMKNKCISFWNELAENDCEGTENKWSEIRFQMKNWKLLEETSSVIDRKKKLNNPFSKFASKLDTDNLDRNIITIVAFLLKENSEGVIFHSIYSFIKIYIKETCPVKIVNVMKKNHHFFEGNLPTEDVVL